MDMDNSARGGKRGRGDSGRSSRAGGGRSAGGGRPQTRDRTLNAIQQAISENNNKDSAQANVRHGKGGKGNSTQISITGWRKSNASTKRDGGVENLISFCERKLNSAPKGSRFKVTKVSPCGSAVATHEFRLFTLATSDCFLVIPQKDPNSPPTSQNGRQPWITPVSLISLSLLDFSFALLQSQIILRFSDLQLVAG